MYYSCKAHLDELISSLEDDGKERRLLSALKAKYKTMVKHMEITEALTEAARGMAIKQNHHKTPKISPGFILFQNSILVGILGVLGSEGILHSKVGGRS